MYETAIRMGIEADPRGRELVERSLATVKRYLAKALVYVQKSVSQQERWARARLAPPAASRLFGGGR